jgi:aminopeptidase N
MPTDTDGFVLLADYQPFPFRIPDVEMTVEFGPSRTRVTARLTVMPEPDTAPGTPLVLDGNGLNLDSISIDDSAIASDSFAVEETRLTIHNPPPRRFVLETAVTLLPEQNTELMGLYRSSGIWCTQCEPEGFRRITWFPDRPDVLSRYRVKLIAERIAAPALLVNGNLEQAGDLSDGRHFAVWNDPHPKPSYLFAMVAGDLGSIADSFTTMSGRNVDLNIYCEHGKEDQCHYAMDSLKRSMAWDERRFGREYDLDIFNIVAVSDFNFGAMENKGLNLFNDKYVLARPETATDGDYAGIESVIAHEYFHNWTGNRITCRDWFQLCLKEGLTVYRDQEFSSDERSRAVKRIEDVRALRAAQFPEDGGPLAHPARPDRFREINNFYTATVYEKGAEIVRMLATFLGTDGFRRGMDRYFTKHDGEAATVEDFVAVFAEANHTDLDQFFKWYEQAGTPAITVTEAWNETDRTYTLRLEQKTAPTPGQPDKAPMAMPVRFGLVGPNGGDMQWRSVSGGKVEDDLITFDTESVELHFEGLANKPVPSLFRGFSAPVTVKPFLKADDKLFLARHDSDPFNRWEAVQDVAMELMLEAVREGSDVAALPVTGGLIDALGSTLADTVLDNAFKAHVLALPTENNIAQKLERDVDPARIHEVRNALGAAIGVALADPLKAAYEGLAISDSYSPAAAQAAQRGFRNQCLALLVRGREDAKELVVEHYRAAANMTDRVAALGQAVSLWLPEAPKLLADFRERFGGDPLVFDKWLTFNALAPDAGCLDRVRGLLEAPDFPRNNPNRLRSLVGTFAMSNPVQFARADGTGFEFVAAFCADVDGRNPQVAARVLTAFRSFRSYEPKRRAAAQLALESIDSKSDLSRNTRDILTRTLAT